MAKEFFKNLPDTSTPFNASRLNGLLNGNEAMGSIVVEDIKCKNLLNDSIILKLVNCEKNNGTIKQTSADTSDGLYWKIQTYLNDTTVSNPKTILKNDIGKLSLEFRKYSSFNQVGFGLNGSAKDTLIVFDASSLKDGEDYVISFDITNVTQGSITLENIQLEKGIIATDFVQAKEFSVTTSPIQLTFNDNYVYSSDRQYNCFRIGKMVFLQIYHMAFKSSPEHGEYIIYGLPKPVNGSNIFYLYGGNLAKGDTCRCYQSWDTGDILVYYGSPSHTGDSANNQYAGILIYETRE